MAIRNIRKYPDDILRKKSRDIIITNENMDKLKLLIEDMFDTLKVNDGIGLAAVQVGILKRLIVIEYENKKYVLINPIVVEAEGSQMCEEGCLSFPNEFFSVNRPTNIVVEYLDENGEKQVLKEKGVLAVVLSHETDHLDGILYIDKKVE
ncbi:MAG: peptide deformylase [Clostridia bacterium]|nr:peptide deformylase [Clostridia bacterium]